jgi:hypothetical protein
LGNHLEKLLKDSFFFTKISIPSIYEGYRETLGVAQSKVNNRANYFVYKTSHITKIRANSYNNLSRAIL